MRKGEQKGLFGHVTLIITGDTNYKIYRNILKILNVNLTENP